MEQSSHTNTDQNQTVSPAAETSETTTALKTATVATSETPAGSSAAATSETLASSAAENTPKKPRFRIRGSVIGVLAGALIIIALMVNSCVFSSQVGALSVQVNTSNASLSQVNVGVYKGIASEVLTDDNPNNDPEAFYTATVNTNTACALDGVTEQGTYTLTVEPTLSNTNEGDTEATANDASNGNNAEASSGTQAEFQSPKPQIVNLKDEDIALTFNLEG